MSEKMKFFLNSNPGYIVIPRALAEHLIQEITIGNATTLYGYLLLSANYVQSQTPAGIVRRGELNVTTGKNGHVHTGHRSHHDAISGYDNPNRRKHRTRIMLATLKTFFQSSKLFFAPWEKYFLKGGKDSPAQFLSYIDQYVE